MKAATPGVIHRVCTPRRRKGQAVLRDTIAHPDARADDRVRILEPRGYPGETTILAQLMRGPTLHIDGSTEASMRHDTDNDLPAISPVLQVQRAGAECSTT